MHKRALISLSVLAALFGGSFEVEGQYTRGSYIEKRSRKDPETGEVITRYSQPAPRSRGQEYRDEHGQIRRREAHRSTSEYTSRRVDGKIVRERK